MSRRSTRGGGLRAASLRVAVAALAVLAAPASAVAQEPPPGFQAAPPPAASEPGPVQPAPEPPRPVRLSGRNDVYRWSFVERRTIARKRPSNRAAKLMRLSTRTPERTANLVQVLSRVTADGRQWIRVRLPMLPNNTTGWVPRDALGGYEVVRTHLLVDTRRRTMRLRSSGRTVLRARIGVGKSRWPTPTGRFYVRNELRGFVSPVYGPVAFGTSARSAVLTDWPGGGFIGIHGTDQPLLIPGRISHGCIRLRNPDILRLARLMPVGTPITIT